MADKGLPKKTQIVFLIAGALALFRGTYGLYVQVIEYEQGVLSSPNFPNNYPSKKDYVWIFQTAPGNRIRLEFTSFALEAAEKCKYDFLEILDGGYRTSPSLGRFCGSEIPPHFISTGNEMTLNFHTDARTEAKGFQVIYMTVPGSKQSCSADQFPCLNGKCVRRSWFCDSGDDCGDNSDERYCDSDSNAFETCPNVLPPWTFCANRRRCYPAVWKCDGRKDCDDGSDERNCQSGIRSVSGVNVTERNLTQNFLRAAQHEKRPINKYSTDVTRVAVALFLNDRQFFAPGNNTGEEISYELSLQLLSKLALKKRISTNDLALYINALTAACINPKDFFGVNLVDELRKRVNNSNYTNPFSILALCIAKDTMTTNDVLKLQQQFDAQLRPIWTDTQAMVVMALSCISSQTGVSVDERIIDEMVSELKKKQHKNSTIDNLKTTALVVQALLAAENYRSDFDLVGAIKFILQEVRRTYPSIRDIYYILPIFNSLSLVNISSEHCETLIQTDLESMKNLREHADERIQVQVSVVIGDNVDFSRTWKIKVPSNYSFYQVLENIGTLEPAYKFQYGVSGGKPFVVGLSKFQDDTEDEFFWFIYTKPLLSSGGLKLVEESPIDIQVRATDELVLWYKSGFWVNLQEDSSG